MTRGSRRLQVSGKQHLGATQHHPQVPPESKNKACRQWVPQEPGRPCHLRLTIRKGRAGNLFQAYPGFVCPGIRSEDPDDKRYPKAKETKPEETDGRESERPIVPVSQGNPPQGTLRREGGVCSWNFWRERCKGHRARTTSQRDCGR